MGSNAGRLDVLTQGRSTALARQEGLPGTFLDLEQALVAAEKIAKSGLVGRDLQNPAAVVRVGLKGQAMGIDFFEAVDVIDVIDRKPVPNAQCRLGHIRQRGHEAEFVFDECDREKATIRGRRREHRHDPKGWKTVVYTIGDAEEQGLLEEWVERKFRRQGDQYDRTEKFILRRTETGYVPAQLGAELPEWAAQAIKAGQVKRKDNWWKNRKSMLRARAASTLYRMHFSDLMFSADAGAYTAEELGHDQGSDVDDYDQPDDPEIFDAEVVYVEQGEDPGPIGHAAAAPPGPVVATHEPEGVGDNGDAQVVGASVAPPPPGPGDWPALAKAHGVTLAGLLRKGREFAEARGLPLPASIEEVTDEQVVADIVDWLGEPL